VTVDVLAPLAAAKEPQFLEASTATLEQRTLLASFVDSGLVSGVYRRDELGRPSDFANLTLSKEGQEYLIKVLKEEDDRTSVGFIKNRWPKIVSWFFGVLAVVVAAWLASVYVSQ